jgi:hypothetical protein
VTTRGTCGIVRAENEELGAMNDTMKNEYLPPELIEFERLLNMPNNDPTGLAGYFNAGEVWVSRVPARLDVMGGIAD